LVSCVAGVKAFSKSLEVIGDNIANVNSTGFKRSRVTNKDSFSQTYEQSTAGVAGGANGSNSMQIGSGTSVANISQTFNQGVLSNTGGPTDLGISGKGFFQVQNPATGENLYTRAGDFILDNLGNLLTNDSYNIMGFGTGISSTSVLPQTLPVTLTANSKLQIPPTITSGADKYTLQSFAIQDDGQIKATYSGIDTTTGKALTTPFQTVITGQIALANFANPNALERAGNNLLRSNAAAGLSPTTAPAGGGFASQTSQIIQGTLELSNVDLTQEFSDIIVAQRAFQANSRVITVSDSVLEEVVNLKR